MKIINGLNYHHKIESMIQECCQQAISNPHQNYLFIVNQKEVVEKLFLKHIHYLVNIEIMTFSSFLKQQIIQNHYTKHHVLNDIEFTYLIRYIFETHHFECFDNHQIYPLIDKLIPLMKDYDINSIRYSSQDFTQQMKLIDFMNLYQMIQDNAGEYTHLTLESLFDECLFPSISYQHIYIEGDHLYQQKRQDIIERLSQVTDVTLLYTHQNDKRIFNMPYHHFCQNATLYDSHQFLLDNLFLQNPETCQDEHNYYTFTSPTLHQEVKRVLYTIAQKVIDEDLHYSDFMIVYPDSSYIDLLMNQLSILNIPHHLPQTLSCQYDHSYQLILKTIDGLNALTISEFATCLNQEDLDSKYHQYLESLIPYQDKISTEEFRDFFISTCHLETIEKSQVQDHISICAIEQAHSTHLQHIYILGMNETILPHSIKDTALLLDEDIYLLRQHHISTPLTTLEQLGVHHNDILKLLSQTSLDMTFSYAHHSLSGETLLPSSLYKQLEKMFTLNPIAMYTYLPLDEFYQFGGQVENKATLNQFIQQYIHFKNQPTDISINTLQSLYSPTLSVSQIETYNKCPFQYFIQYGLGVYPPKQKELLPNELGSLVHYVLSIMIDQNQDIDQLVDAYLLQDESLSQKITSSKINQYFIEQLKKDLQVTLDIVRRQLSFSRFEVLVKEEKVTDDIHGIQFKGFVDRIDQYENKISIIDYKSSAKDIDLNLAMQGFNIQMLLYLKIVTKTYQKDPGSVLYFNTKKRILSLDQSLNDAIDEQEFYKQYCYGGYVIDDGSHDIIHALDSHMEKKSDIINVTYVKTRDEYKGHLLTPDQLEILFENIEEHIYQLYTEMLNGKINITPKGSDQSATHTLVNPCRYCPYHSVCGFDVFYNDYTLVDFLDVEKILGGNSDAI